MIQPPSAIAGYDAERLALFRYATAEAAPDYVALMRLFTSTLLADMSAAEASAALGEVGTDLSVEDVETRCKQLEEWGNVVRSIRDARVSTVAEWLRSRTRYQASKMGGRVHRQVEEVLHASAGARDVARELLGTTVDQLDRILAAMEGPGPVEPDAVAGEVTGVFLNQQVFTASASDFYAYLNQVLSRYDLAGAEYSGFKELLLTYVDLITADVARHAPVIADRLSRLDPHLDRLLEILATVVSLTGPDGESAERSPGRVRSDWEQLAIWYSGPTGRSGPAQLRQAAEQALGQLLANAKRMLAASGTGMSRRTDLLRLAGWFAEADDETAHRIYAAAFGAYPARHLLAGPDEDQAESDPKEGRGNSATTSWWAADPVDVAVSLRERGDRAARGRTSPVPDPGLDRAALLAEAAADAQRNRAAAAELVAAGDLNGAKISPAARDVLLDRLGALLAANQDLTGPVELVDTDLGLVLHAQPSPSQALNWPGPAKHDERVTVVLGEDGQVRVGGLSLRVTAVADDIVNDLLDDLLGVEVDRGSSAAPLTGTGP